jgi:Protein of unknown function (DUF1153)
MRLNQTTRLPLPFQKSDAERTSSAWHGAPQLTVDQFISWQYCVDQDGLAGLRTTRTQQYRHSRERNRGCGYSASIPDAKTTPLAGGRRSCVLRPRGRGEFSGNPQSVIAAHLCGSAIC